MRLRRSRARNLISMLAQRKKSSASLLSIFRVSELNHSRTIIVVVVTLIVSDLKFILLSFII